MNHGYCEKCWWWEPLKYDIQQARYVLGACWMNFYPNAEYDSYCPDYYNRKNGNKESGTLQHWIENLPAGAERPENRY